jgi:hypothetical protein
MKQFIDAPLSLVNGSTFFRLAELWLADATCGKGEHAVRKQFSVPSAELQDCA